MDFFTDDESRRLAPFFTNTDLPVFGLCNLPEVIKGALFARYSRTSKSLRRLFLDEFLHRPDATIAKVEENLWHEGVDHAHVRAKQLYERVFTEYGDDSVAQLGAAHVACEGVSNVLTKLLERGRLAAYLEQSTRYILFDQKQEGRWRYSVPDEIENPGLRRNYTETLDHLFAVYSYTVHQLIARFTSQLPRPNGTSDVAWRSTLRSKACDLARGLLPAATQANLGIFASGQSYELLLLKLFASRNLEAQQCAKLLLQELRKLIPSFVKRVDIPERGGTWIQYFQNISTNIGQRFISKESILPDSKDEVTLVEWDPDGETKVIAAILFEYGNLSTTAAEQLTAGLSGERRRSIMQAYVGERSNRRHRPGRAFERTAYKFDCVSDYGAFRDLQRHRLLTVEWQQLGTDLGYMTPDGLSDEMTSSWHDAMKRAGTLHTAVSTEYGPHVAQYCVPFAYRIRYTFQLNARAAMHMIELRTQPQGHQSYRKICAEMFRLIATKAQHTLIAESFAFVNLEDVTFARLESERAAEARAINER